MSHVRLYTPSNSNTSSPYGLGTQSKTLLFSGLKTILDQDTISFGRSHEQIEAQLSPIEELTKRKDDLKGYYEKAQAITNYIQEEFNSLQANNDSVNPYFDCIPFTGAIGLRVSNNIPYSLITPLGEMRILSGGIVPRNRSDIVNNLVSRLGLVEIQRNDYQVIYAITKDIDNNPIPQLAPNTITPYRTLKNEEYEATVTIWNDVCPEGRTKKSL